MTDRPNKPRDCSHPSLCLDVSSHAAQAGFTRPSQRERMAAATKDGRFGKSWQTLTSKDLFNHEATFPAPLVLPDDDLATDPDWPPQDVKEWAEEEERNAITPQRKTIYVVRSPEITREMEAMRSWAVPAVSDTSDAPVKGESLKMDDVQAYLAAVYYGMDVKILDRKFHWQAWEYEKVSSRASTGQGKASGRIRKPKYDGTPLEDPEEERRVGLKTPQNAVFGIRCRPSPDGVSLMQVNLDDVLDALLESIPKDAFAIMMLLEQDIWEGDDEIFTGGRAYGGSRIAVVSGFRDQHSCLPEDDGHGWPLSHCSNYVDKLCLRPRASTKARARIGNLGSGPMYAAARASASTLQHPDPEKLSTEWMSRIVQTVSHELGHCLGLDHCVYFACVMQGAGSTAEGVRQPPYFCPVCLEKVVTGIGEGLVEGWNDPGLEVDKQPRRSRFVRERYEALRRVCERLNDRKDSRMFVGYQAWLESVLEQNK
ncbi:Archaemetzincin-2 [Tolypocladium ophioglossoides CBS 100239]|uniref:Archaemetzincin-2 n=1 Tax=Tolypocladium ophioglossoides (strain CBS 100239) TaxID=1163406 RepID=A0A0L0NIB4_TOLOC|nr:Archaemetzincin-2 [Tolypocladium ophioglossoides CBS 100239]